MTHTIVGLFDDRDDAQGAMEDLIEEGFIKENIDLSNRRMANSDAGDTNADGQPGLGDRIGNFFSSLFGGDETSARNYTNAAQSAEAILTVQADSDDRAKLAQEIMDRNDAIDVDGRSTEFTGGSESTGRTSDVEAGAKRTIPVVQENLDVGKREVERGGARIRSRIVEKPVEENIRLREEHVVVNRRPVDREVTKGDLENFRPGEMEITEHAEVPIVGKRARVVEEVEVGKDVTEREETVRDSVKRTEVDVDKIDPSTDTPPDDQAKRARG